MRVTITFAMCISYKGGCQPGTTFWVVQLQNYQQYEIRWIFFYIYIYTSMDTEMCCPKSKCGCQYYIILTLKKKSWTQGPGFFIIKN
jgi:hypothetical protein